MKPRNIRIKTVLNGWIVEVGCQTLVFEKLESLVHELKAYLENPMATQDRYGKESVNAEFFSFAEAIGSDDQECTALQDEPEHRA